MYGLYNGFDGMMGWFGGGFMMFVFWALLVLFVIWMVRESKHGTPHSHSEALQILKERYAKGEITKKEFEEKKEDIA